MRNAIVFLLALMLVAAQGCPGEDDDPPQGPPARGARLLGIRNNDGSEKAAFGRIRQEAEARGW